MLEEKIIKKTTKTFETINTGGSWSKLFIFKDQLYGVGLNNRFDWPTTQNIYQIRDTGRTRLLYENLDRTIVDVKCTESFMYILYEDSGKQLLAKGDGTNLEKLVDEQVTISDFTVGSPVISVIANSFS